MQVKDTGHNSIFYFSEFTMVEKMMSTHYQYDFVQKHLQNLCETSGDSGVLIYYDKKNKQLKYWCKKLFHITSNKTFQCCKYIGI